MRRSRLFRRLVTAFAYAYVFVFSTAAFARFVLYRLRLSGKIKPDIARTRDAYDRATGPVLAAMNQQILPET